MIKVTLIALGSLKEKYLREAVDEYLKRLKGYCNLTQIEIEPVKLPEKPSQGEISSALSKEAELILKKIPDNNTVIAMCIEGKQFSSEGFAELIGNSADLGKGITIIIGSSYGLDEKVKTKADIKLSFSKMTFPHQLFRVLCLEQLYRAFRINTGSAYHK